MSKQKPSIVPTANCFNLLNRQLRELVSGTRDELGREALGAPLKNYPNCDWNWTRGVAVSTSNGFPEKSRNTGNNHEKIQTTSAAYCAASGGMRPVAGKINERAAGKCKSSVPWMAQLPDWLRIQF